MSRFAFSGRAPGGRALASMLLAIGGLAACGSGQPEAVDAVDEVAAAIAAVVPAVPPDKGDCRRFTTCVPENPCHTGWVTGCRRNVPICTDVGGWLSNGTACGTGAVCYLGECEPCAAGQSCPIKDPYGNVDVCRAGAISCETGQPVCEEQGPAPDGTNCSDGGPFVCMGGTCSCVPDQPCRPWNACYAGRSVCWDPYNGYCEQRDPLPDGTSCGDSMVCRAGSCSTCGPGSWCQSPDPCYGSGTLSCATAQCEPTPPAYESGWPCGVGGETCQSAVCTDDADPRLVVRSASWSVDLTGTSWSRGCEASELASTRVTDTFGLGTITHVVETFATPDCTGSPETQTGEGAVTSAGDRYAGWTGGTPPPGAPWSLTATAVRYDVVDPVQGPVEMKSLLWVNDWVFPHQLFQGDPSHALGADGYPTLLYPETRPLTEVVPPCVPDQPCTPGNACYAGRMVCWSEYGGYCEQRDPLPDGTSCGVDLVCSGGGCQSCGPAASCQSPDPCYASGAVSCTTGRCEPQPPAYENGWTCGVGGESCQGGTCTPVAGADPWVRSTSGAVNLAGTTWTACMPNEPDPGMSRLRVDTYAAGEITHRDVVFTGGVDCTGPTDPARGFTVVGTIASGGDRPASWDGGYVPPGLPDSPTATGIDVSATDPTIGLINFKELLFVHDAVSPRQLYSGEEKSGAFYPSKLGGGMPMFEVLGCNAGEACSPGFATCEVFQVDCSASVPICAGTGTFLPNATRCADGHSWCQAGVCEPVPTRTVSGTALMTYWPDSGALASTDPVGIQTVAAVQFAGGFAFHPGMIYPDGSFEVPGVEVGGYLLEVSTPALAYFHETADLLDLGADALGRRDLAWPIGPTPVFFDVKGLVPWVRGDVLAFASSNAGVAAMPFGPQDSTGVPEGLDQLTGPFEWYGRPLVSGAAGDVAYVFQASTTWAPSGERITAASRWAQLPVTFEIADVAGGLVDATLDACPGSGSVSADWRRGEFEGYAAMVHPEASPLNHRIVVGARPHDSPFAPGFRVGNLAQYPGLPLLVVQVAAPAASTTLDASYGRFLPPLWREYRHDRLMIGVNFLAPGATRTARLGAPIGYDVAADRAPSVVTPLLGPPGDLRIAGLDAWSGGIAGVGTQPRITWTAPVVSPEAATVLPGATLEYKVAVHEIQPTADGGTLIVRQFEATTARSTISLPGTNMYYGGRYVVTVEAALTTEVLTAPLHASVERAYATVVSREFTP